MKNAFLFFLSISAGKSAYATRLPSTLLKLAFVSSPDARKVTILRILGDNTPDFGLQPEELQQLESLFSRFDLHTGKLRTGVTQLKITDFTGENKQSLSGKKRANDLLGEQGRQVTGETQEDAGSAKSRKTDSKVTGEDM